MALYEQIFWLISLHFIADFQLQNEFIADNKGKDASKYWPIVLSAHSAGHGVMVALILGPIAGILEFVSHWLIDLAKSSHLLGKENTAFYIDQGLHVGLKFVWIACGYQFGWGGVISQL